RLRIDTEKDEYKKAVDTEYRSKEQALDERKQQLDKRQEEMDLADAKSTRRKMRQAILEKLKPEGVMSLNRAAMIPIHILLIIVSVLFLFFGVSVMRGEGFDPLVLTHAVKLGLASVGFVGTLMLYYRWMDSWLRKGVDENLRVRQLAVDVDRSTWLIEVLSELKSETGAEIPNDVLVALTRNLFAERGSSDGVKHPAEDVLAALLGSSREVELDLPGGRVRIDGRSIRKVAKDADKES
ncbi:MAG: hypothetical protein R3305_08320, partial [Gammaproteobacteria bacterium]|nr:hypothetical protein [Gammaproteobacteria bacterium]